MHKHKVRLIKGEAPIKLVALILGKIERNENEGDPFGLKALDFLIQALEVLDTKTQTWGAIAKYLLKKARTSVGGFYYEPLLFKLAPHVSVAVLVQITGHLASEGNFAVLASITTTVLNRKPSFAEILAIAEYHRKKWTSSKDKVWGQILSLANEDDVPAIKKMIAEVEMHEKTPDLF